MIDALDADRSGLQRTVFNILGPVEVRGPGGHVRIPPGRQEIVLAALLLESNRVVGTDQLVDLIWGDDPPGTARTQVQICVSRLRRTITDAGVEAPITTRAPGYVLNAPDELLDVRLFGSRVTEARGMVRTGRCAEAADLLRSAVSLWRGPCLDGVLSEALRGRALQLDEERLTAVETYLQLELDLGRHHQLVGEISRLVHENPLRERLRGHLMLALYRSGRQAEALEAYRTARALLLEELGLEPGEELKRLESAILTGDASLSAGAETAEAARRPAGPSRPEGREPQEEAESGADAASAAPSRDRVPHQLPADTADFVGDDGLIGTVTSLLAEGGTRSAVGIAVIIGKPGIGKSTFATHVAHRLSAEHFPDGQLYCDLRGTGLVPVSAQDVLGRFLRALGIPGPVLPDSLDERAEMYRTLLATRRVLVVLDDAASESQIRPLLPGTSTCAVIVTSRTRITGVPGARRIELDVLDAGQAQDLLGRIIGPERVAAEGEAAQALVRTVGGLPLALRIVAARLAARPHWSLASMVHRLANERNRLDELTHGEMTMRASLSLTHDGLGATEQRLLRLLSLAHGPALPGWLAGALLDDRRPYPSDLLEPLVDVQMLDVVGVEHTGEFRYRFHEIIRVFARDLLVAHGDEQERTAAVERMLGGWLALAELAHSKVYGGDYTVLHGRARRWHPPAAYVDALLADPLEWMDQEQANLCHAVEHAAQEGLDELAWDLATTLVTLFEARGYLDQWERTHTLALEAVRRAGNLRGTAALLTSMGTLYLSRRQATQSHASLTSALDLFDRLGDASGRALCRRDLALLARFQGDDDQALDLYAHALRDFERGGDVVGRAIVLTQRAHIWMRRGRTAEAHVQLEEALEVFRSVGYTGGQARALRRVGQVLVQRGEHERAAQTFSEVLHMVRESGDVIGEGHLLRDLGDAHVRMGRLGQARELLQRALAVREQIMDAGGAAVVRLDLARLGDGSDGPGAIAELLETAVATFRDRGMSRELREAEALLAPGERGVSGVPAPRHRADLATSTPAARLTPQDFTTPAPALPLPAGPYGQGSSLLPGDGAV
ncbi:BTAD domain-containing putative transcriptional regulator [Streptomyces longwoodensis]|uniref:AfsR/SARP family transcriptional regulator n=1 Tax=Streptomyces longwoodensis TaxID=68231 RepID=UPI0034052F67